MLPTIFIFDSMYLEHSKHFEMKNNLTQIRNKCQFELIIENFQDNISDENWNFARVTLWIQKLKSVLRTTFKTAT